MQQKNKIMKYINYIYFNIYCWYYKMKADGRKVDPTGMTAIMFGLFFGGCFFLIDWIYYHFILHSYPGNIHEFVLIFVVILFSGIINQIYLSNNRYQKVYNDYSSLGVVKNKKRAMLFSFFIIFLPYLILAAFGILLALEG